MAVVDFEDWVRPDLELTLKGKTYTVPAPDVERAQQLLAAAVIGELRLGIVKGDVPKEVATVMARTAVGEHFALTEPVYREMVADGVNQVTIDRMSYYTVFYWARGKEYADELASLMWAPEIAAQVAAENAPEDDKPAPKAPRSSRRKSGSRSA